MKHLLVIDDNIDIRENTAEILALAGYRVSTAENGKRGVEFALREIPDLIICDIMMPDLDGYGVPHLLKKNTSTENIPFIFLTAKTERNDFRKGMELGADDYLTKPFDDLELLKAVETRLKKAELVQIQYANNETGAGAFLKDLNEKGIMALDPGQYESETFHRKAMIYVETRRPKNLYYIRSGKVKAFRVHENGKEYITNLYQSGDYLGHIPLIEGINYEDSAMVLEDAEIVLIPKDDFLNAVYNDLGIASNLSA